MTREQAKLDAFLRELRACTVCAAELPLGPRWCEGMYRRG
jgi:hypothetical protein